GWRSSQPPARGERRLLLNRSRVGKDGHRKMATGTRHLAGVAFVTESILAAIVVAVDELAREARFEEEAAPEQGSARIVGPAVARVGAGGRQLGGRVKGESRSRGVGDDRVRIVEPPLGTAAIELGARLRGASTAAGHEPKCCAIPRECARNAQ